MTAFWQYKPPPQSQDDYTAEICAGRSTTRHKMTIHVYNDGPDSVIADRYIQDNVQAFASSDATRNEYSLVIGDSSSFVFFACCCKIPFSPVFVTDVSYVVSEKGS
jgi:hypothetical protein